jgi:hypothetical protein
VSDANAPDRNVGCTTKPRQLKPLKGHNSSKLIRFDEMQNAQDCISFGWLDFIEVFVLEDNTDLNALDARLWVDGAAR